MPGIDLADGVVVVTGASSGIGRTTAQRLSRRGTRLVLAARCRETLEQAAAECAALGAETLVVPTDVSDLTAVQHLAQRAIERFGRIDGWVNAAAVMAYGHFEQIPWDVFRQVIETNLLGPLHGARAALPQFRAQRSGVLVSVDSVWGTVTSPYVSAYVTSKFAVRAFSECLQEGLRLEPEMRDVRVCTVLPQSVDTTIFQHAANYTGRAPKPVPPIVDPERVARAIVRSLEHPRRQRSVGAFGRGLQVGRAILPSVYARVVPRAMDRLGFANSAAASGPGNVLAPLPELNRRDGGWRRNRPSAVWRRIRTRVGRGRDRPGPKQ